LFSCVLAPDSDGVIKGCYLKDRGAGPGRCGFVPAVRESMHVDADRAD
jgi:hypothetical protein